MPGWFSENAPPRPPLGVPCLLRRGNVYLRYFRSGQGPQVLLLPALARSPSDFNELVEFLCGRAFQTLALEGRGVGESRAPLRPRATLSDLAADVAAVVGDNGGRVHVIGRGLGNRVARAFAAEYPQMALSVVLIASGGKYAPPRRWQLAWDALVSSNSLLPRRWRWARWGPADVRPRTPPARLHALRAEPPCACASVAGRTAGNESQTLARGRCADLVRSRRAGSCGSADERPGTARCVSRPGAARNDSAGRARCLVRTLGNCVRSDWRVS